MSKASDIKALSETLNLYKNGSETHKRISGLIEKMMTALEKEYG